MQTIESVSALAMPLVVLAVGIIMLMGKRDYFAAFCAGARDGLKTAVGLFPTLSALIVATSMLHASGATTYLASLFAPAADAIGLPSELLPLLVVRPFSGSASTASYTELLSRVGADSFAGLCASVIYGSSDTAVYILCVYFSSVGIKRSGWAFPCAFAVMLFCIFFSCFLCRLCF